jgi:hypothetical protein
VETFIVRVWTPSPDLADEIPTPELHGNVEHVGTRRSSAFRTSEELVELLKAVLEPGDDPLPRP